MGFEQHILVVDDHADIREPLVAYLRRYGLRVTAVADARAMRDQLEREKFDLVLLDIMLPDEDGLSLCRYVYEHLRTPVILLTAMADPADRVAGLELGADDYVVKPFDPRELVARIRVIFRRMRERAPAAPAAEAGSPIYGFGNWTLDTGRRELRTVEGEPVELAAMEYKLLKVMVENANTVLSREKLLSLMNRGSVAVIDRSIDIQVSRLRKKLEEDTRRPRLLRTAWGDGYLLSVDVRTVAP